MDQNWAVTNSGRHRFMKSRRLSALYIWPFYFPRFFLIEKEKSYACSRFAHFVIKQRVPLTNLNLSKKKSRKKQKYEFLRFKKLTLFNASNLERIKNKLSVSRSLSYVGQNKKPYYYFFAYSVSDYQLGMQN